MLRDRWSALGLAALAVGYLIVDRRYPLDTLATPGPGLFPLVAGVALLALAAWQFVTPRPQRARDATSVVEERAAVARPLVMAAVLIVYAALFPVIGFVTASLALVFVSSRLMGLGGWWRPAALALGITAVSRVIFVTWLGVPLR